MKQKADHEVASAKQADSIDVPTQPNRSRRDLRRIAIMSTAAMARRAAAVLAIGAAVLAAAGSAHADSVFAGLSPSAVPSNVFPGRSASAAPAIPREIVRYDGGHKAGTIVVDSAERRLYFVLGDGKAVRYGVGVGRPGFGWTGAHAITMKREWPDWRPPASMLQRRPDLPRHMAGGEDNPLGARAMYLGSSIYRIHGSNEPESIGHAVSSGCIRMLNEDVVDLYERVKVGTRVIVR
jgi:lipoprotein-anchoring transpeptidase ErfK/SrfK